MNCATITRSIITAVVIMTGGVWADTWKDGNGHTWTYWVLDGGAMISYGELHLQSFIGSVEIPLTLGGCPVKSIENAFVGCSDLTTITIPDSVTNIGYHAFQYCNGLTSVTIPNSVTSIGEGAFDGCSGLTSVTIPDSVTSIGAFAFANCQGLMSVTIPNRVTSIGSRAFDSCSRLTSVTILDGVTNIGDRTFFNCIGLTSVTIPNSVVNLPNSAFEGCPKLWATWYRTLSNGSATGGGEVGGSAVTTIVQQVVAPYALTDYVADRAIASVTVDADCAIDSFVLKDGKVYDCVVRIVNTTGKDVKVSLPTGYAYETYKGVKPLTIPANSRNMLSITRVADRTFLVSREELEDVR